VEKTTAPPPAAVEPAPALPPIRFQPQLFSVYSSGTHKRFSGLVNRLRDDLGELAGMFGDDDCESAVRLLLGVIGKVRELEIEVSCNILNHGNNGGPDRLAAIFEEPSGAAQP